MGFVKLCTILLICRSSKLTEIKLMCNNSCTKIFTPKVCHQGAICWSKKELFWPYGLDHIFFRNETFLLFNIESWNFQHLFFLKILWNLAISAHSVYSWSNFYFNFSMGRLNGLQFCEVSWNSKSNSCWKFQLSILTNKKVYS